MRKTHVETSPYCQTQWRREGGRGKGKGMRDGRGGWAKEGWEGKRE